MKIWKVQIDFPNLLQNNYAISEISQNIFSLLTMY